MKQANQCYQTMEKAIVFLEELYLEQPSLEAVAAHVGLSPTHFQRCFKLWTGLSPKKFLQYLTINHAKQLLLSGSNVLNGAWDSGLSGPGRLHDLFVTFDAVSPGEFGSQGEGLTIEYGFVESPFGMCLLANSPRGICHLAFCNREEFQSCLLELQRRWSKASLKPKSDRIQKKVDKLFLGIPKGENLLLFVKGSNFQIKVWEALLRIPYGQTVTYGQVAEDISQASASRAVGAAVGANEIAWLIPCHRVIRKHSREQSYRWGWQKKTAMLAYESANRELSV